MKLPILSILLFYIISLSAQHNSFSIGLGSAGTSRILFFPDDNYSNTEIAELKKLEAIKPSFQGELGYSIEKNQAVFIRLGLGFRHTRFGSKRYTIPNGIHNTTPQYSVRKDVVMQNQEFAFIESSFNQYKFLKSSSVFFKLMLIHNHKYYKIFGPSYNKNGHISIGGVLSSDSFTPNRLDVNLSVGLNYHLLQGKHYQLLLQPYLSMFALPYRTDGAYNSYLYFNKDVVGFLWEFGVLAQYKFRL